MEPQRTPETRDEAMHRLAAQAQAKGVQLLVYVPSGEHFATSVSHPGELHRVTMLSCDCQGFQRHQRCMHHAALLAELGELPPLPPAPITPAPQHNRFNLTDQEEVVLRGQAFRIACETNTPIEWYWSDPPAA
jgi:hypothetical protein